MSEDGSAVMSAANTFVFCAMYVRCDFSFRDPMQVHFGTETRAHVYGRSGAACSAQYNIYRETESSKTKQKPFVALFVRIVSRVTAMSISANRSVGRI